MANRHELSSIQWQVIHQILQTLPQVRVGNEARCLAFLNAVVWILRSGTQWRLLPESHAHWNSVFKRFSRWCDKGVWNEIHARCVDQPDLQAVFIDSTVIRAHACAAGAAGSCAENEALGRSCGGFGTKIHAVTDAPGNPLDFILTGGQASDIGQAEALLQLTPEGAQALAADKGYDSDKFVAALEARGMEAIIPPRVNRISPRECDGFAYKERHLIECFFGKIKHYRRIFSRFEKLKRSYMGFL